MSYIVPNELPKSCSRCNYCYLIMQNPLSSKTPIKRYRCQVGKAPWRTFDVDFYDEEYKDKDCPLIPMQEIVERLKKVKMRYFLTIANTGDDKLDFAYEKIGNALDDAIEIVKGVIDANN